MFVTPALAFAVAATPARMPVTKLAAAVEVPNLCVYRYPVSTRSPECQRFCDQALGYYYSYVWIEAARSFETALAHDPDCAFAWLGLSRALDKWGKSNAPKPDAFLALTGALPQAKLPTLFSASPKDWALDRAKQLMPKASHREQLLITAKLHERGMVPGTAPADRKKKATETLDELLALYDDDQEAWFARAQVAEGTHGPTPFYKALLRLNPRHPGASHELVHSSENIRRPALGWPFAEAYMASSPGIPHAFHMQSHLAMRVGKWQHTTDWSKQAMALQLAYHKTQGVTPEEDHQFSHHLETLTRSLLHDGRFAEAAAVKAVAEKNKYSYKPEWFRLAVATKDWAAAAEAVKQFRKASKATGAYYGAVLALERNDLAAARAEIDVLRQAQQKDRGQRQAELRLWEVQGRLACRTGDGPAGVKLFKRTIDKTKDDFAHHAWGGGAYYMEAWGYGALDAGLADEAEEAFQEALAHDAGSARGAVGLWALCSRLGRTDEAGRYLKVADRAWAKADGVAYAELKADAVRRAANIESAATAAR